MTMLSAYFKISANKGRNPFEKQKVWKNNKEVKGDAKNPIIYFSMAFATDVEPEDLLVRISHEWHRRGGIMLKVKDLQSFDGETILCLFNVFTGTNKKTVLEELCEILSKAQALAQDNDPTDFFWDPADLPRHSDLPALELKLMNPKTPGQDTSQYNKLSWRVQANRKVLHVECDKRFSADIKRLAQMAKDYKLVAEMWGKHTHISEVVDKDSTPSEIRRLARVAQVHCNYQCAMVLEDVNGITNLNGHADLYEEGMSSPLRFTLRKLLLQYLRLSDGGQLLAEIHQSSDVMGRVQAVIPNSPEAEQMILMMNKNFPAYVGNVLRDQGLPEPFLIELFRRSCCPTMLAEAESCKWDADSGILTTPRETEENNNLAELEKAAWYKDAFADLGAAKKGGLKPPPEALFNLDGDRSVKTIHHRNENRPAPAAGGSTPPRKDKNEVVNMASSDEESASSSSDEGSRSCAAEGDGNLPSSSVEDNGKAPGAADGG
jgi:hypothetical protein